MSSNRLDQRIVNHLDFTFGDEALIALVDFVKCPLGLATGTHTIIFNNHCYDNSYFDRLRSQAADSNESFADSGYEPGDRRCTHMKDPRTGEEFEYKHAMRTLYFNTLVSRYKLKRILSLRVAGLTQIEAEKYIPGNDLQVVINEFVKFIEVKQEERKVQIEIYEDYCKNRMILAQSTLAAQVTLPHSWVEPPFEDPPPPPPPPPPTFTTFECT